jgi:hypothetical protein
MTFPFSRCHFKHHICSTMAVWDLKTNTAWVRHFNMYTTELHFHVCKLMGNAALKLSHPICTSHIHIYLCNYFLLSLFNYTANTICISYAKEVQRKHTQMYKLCTLLQHLRFTQQCCWRFKSSGMLQCIDWYTCTNVLKVHSAFVFGSMQFKEQCLLR